MLVSSPLSIFQTKITVSPRRTPFNEPKISLKKKKKNAFMSRIRLVKCLENRHSRHNAHVVHLALTIASKISNLEFCVDGVFLLGS